jgi:hypothetical protein
MAFAMSLGHIFGAGHHVVYLYLDTAKAVTDATSAVALLEEIVYIGLFEFGGHRVGANPLPHGKLPNGYSEQCCVRTQDSKNALIPSAFEVTKAFTSSSTAGLACSRHPVPCVTSSKR